MKRASFAVVLGLLAPLAMAGGCDKCKKDEAPPGLPTTTETASAAPETTLEVEDASDADDGDAADGDASDAPKGKYVPAASLKNCCAALAQNAASAPPPMNIYLTQAAAVCNAGVAQGKDKSTIIGMITGALKGAQMPAACR